MKIDLDFISHLLRDENHVAYVFCIYVDRNSGQIHILYDDDEDAECEGLPDGENRQLREQINASLDDFVAIPFPTHGMAHQWFQDFSGLSDVTYVGSIGASLKQHGGDAIRQDWQEYFDLRVGEYVEIKLRDAGVNPEPKQLLE